MTSNDGSIIMPDGTVLRNNGRIIIRPDGTVLVRNIFGRLKLAGYVPPLPGLSNPQFPLEKQPKSPSPVNNLNGPILAIPPAPPRGQ